MASKTRGDGARACRAPSRCPGRDRRAKPCFAVAASSPGCSGVESDNRSRSMHSLLARSGIPRVVVSLLYSSSGFPEAGDRTMERFKRLLPNRRPSRFRLPQSCWSAEDNRLGLGRRRAQTIRGAIQFANATFQISDLAPPAPGCLLRPNRTPRFTKAT